MWQALLAGFMLGREVIKYLRTKDECKIIQREKAIKLVEAARSMRKARKENDAKAIEDVFRTLNLDKPDGVSGS